MKKKQHNYYQFAYKSLEEDVKAIYSKYNKHDLTKLKPKNRFIMDLILERQFENRMTSKDFQHLNLSITELLDEMVKGENYDFYLKTDVTRQYEEKQKRKRLTNTD